MNRLQAPGESPDQTAADALPPVILPNRDILEIGIAGTVTNGAAHPDNVLAYAGDQKAVAATDQALHQIRFKVGCRPPSGSPIKGKDL